MNSRPYHSTARKIGPGQYQDDDGGLWDSPPPGYIPEPPPPRSTSPTAGLGIIDDAGEWLAKTGIGAAQELATPEGRQRIIDAMTPRDVTWGEKRLAPGWALGPLAPLTTPAAEKVGKFAFDTLTAPLVATERTLQGFAAARSRGQQYQVPFEDMLAMAVPPVTAGGVSAKFLDEAAGSWNAFGRTNGGAGRGRVLQSKLEIPAVRLSNEPQRPINADYPDYLPAPEGVPPSPLRRTPEGHVIQAKYIAGRRTTDGVDVSLSDQELNSIAETLTKVRTVRGAEMGNAIGRHRVIRGGQNEIDIREGMSPERTYNALAHETSHELDWRAGGLDLAGVRNDAKQLYSHLLEGRKRPSKWTGPREIGYKPQEVTSELVAEAARAYMGNPNAMKTHYPKLAEYLRLRFNGQTETNHLIQFNANPARARLVAMLANDPKTSTAAAGALPTWEREYHGTTATFNRAQKQNKSGGYPAVYSTPSGEFASMFAEGRGGRVLPLDVDKTGFADLTNEAHLDRIAQHLLRSMDPGGQRGRSVADARKYLETAIVNGRLEWANSNMARAVDEAGFSGVNMNDAYGYPSSAMFRKGTARGAHTKKAFFANPARARLVAMLMAARQDQDRARAAEGRR